MTVSRGWESWDDRVAFSNSNSIVSIVTSLSRVPYVHLCDLYHVYSMYIHGFSLDVSLVLVGNRILSYRSHVPSKSVLWVVTSFLRVAPWHFIALVKPLRILARPATSVSLCQPAAMARTVRLSTRLQPDVTPLAADPDIVFEFEGVD
jgi:hypothetical protein